MFVLGDCFTGYSILTKDTQIVSHNGGLFQKVEAPKKAPVKIFLIFFSFLQIPGKDTVSQTFYHIDLHHFTSSKNQFKQYSDHGYQIYWHGNKDLIYHVE